MYGGIPYGDTIGFEAITPTTATGISRSMWTTSGGLQAKTALVSVEAHPIRFRSDGTDPTADVGHIVPAGGNFMITSHVDIRAIRMIDTAAGASIVSVTTYA